MDNKTNMHDTHALIDTRRRQANKSHTGFNYRSIQPLENNTIANHPRMNNNNENQNARQFLNDRQVRYHWRADDDIMAIIINRENSPETTELVRRRIELARHGAVRSQWNKGLDKGIYVPRTAEQEERREMKRTHRWRIFQKLWRRNTTETAKS